MKKKDLQKIIIELDEVIKQKDIDLDKYKNDFKIKTRKDFNSDFELCKKIMEKYGFEVQLKHEMTKTFSGLINEYNINIVRD